MEELIITALAAETLDGLTPPTPPLELPVLRTALLDALAHPALRLSPASADALFALAIMGLKAQALGSSAPADVANHTDAKLRCLREVVGRSRAGAAVGAAGGVGGAGGRPGGIGTTDGAVLGRPSTNPSSGSSGATVTAGGDGGGGGRGAAGGGNSGLPGPPRRSAGLPPSGGPASVSASAALSVIAAARERLAALYERPPPGELRRLRVAVLNTLRAVAVPVSPLIADGLQAPAGWLVVAPVGARGAHLGAAALFGRDGETVTDAYVLPIAGKGGGDSGSGGGGGGDPGCRGRVGGGGHIGASAMGMGGRGGGASDGGGDGGGGRPGYRPDNLYSPARLAARRQHAAGGIVAVGSPVDGGSASGGGVRRAPSGASAVWDGPPTGGGGAAVPLHEGEALLPTGGEGDGWAS